jgi:hypothetical protein
MEQQLQVRDQTGEQARARLRQNDVERILADAHLPATQRSLVLDYIGSALVRARREELGGARYLRERAAEMPASLPAMRATLEQLATAFVYPGAS